jgi:3-oxoacyl-[acyl-carrier protein] reductase
MISLKNKVTVITGGSRGVGAACAVMFAQAGSDIVINYRRSNEAANQVAHRVADHGQRCVTVAGNIAKLDVAKHLIETTMREFGKVDILINNAGIWSSLKIGKTKEEAFESVLNELLDVNLRSCFYTAHFATPHFKQNGGGKIINVSSTAGQRGEAHHSHYAASKGGIIAFTKSLASELAEHRILVNCVAPGWIDNDLNAEVFSDSDFKRQVAESIPLKKIASNEDVASSILFLASDLANHITGEVINVNGGAVLCG